MKVVNAGASHFYQSLGKLFYAVAAVDKHIEMLEVDKLNELMEKVWGEVGFFSEIDTETSEIITVFEALNNANSDAEKCFLEFVDYKKQHPRLFTDKVNKRILKTAGAIANSFSKLNKSELIMLAKLNIELKKYR